MDEAKNLESKEQPAREAWGNTTNPKNHNPSSFRYLVYGINPMAKLTIPSIMHQEISDRTGKGKSVDDSVRSGQSVDLLAHPEQLVRRASLSMSLIDQEHLGTWGSGGLIVQVPRGNVLLTSSEDLGAANWNIDRLRERGKKEPPIEAGILLQKTTPSNYNEVVAVTQTESGNIQLQGFFIKTNVDGNPISQTLVDEIKKQAERLHLPVVLIKEYSPYSEDKVIETDKRIEVWIGGKVYTLYLQPNYPQGSEGKWNFRFYDQKSSRFISPDELETVLQFGQARGLQSNPDEIRAKYAEADSERQKPKVEFDEQGNIKSIKRKTGYKDNEEELAISKGGSLRNNLKKYSERISRAFYSSGSNATKSSNDDFFQGWSYLSPYEVKQLIDEVKGSFAPGEHEKLEKFAQEINEKVQKNWEYQLVRLKR